MTERGDRPLIAYQEEYHQRGYSEGNFIFVSLGSLLHALIQPSRITQHLQLQTVEDIWALAKLCRGHVPAQG
jgi:hypothetical protein